MSRRIHVGRVTFVIFISLLSLSSCTNLDGPVKIGAIFPEDSFQYRVYSSTLRITVKGLARERPLLGQIGVKDQPIFLEDYSPPEILAVFCNVILKDKINTVLYMSKNDFSGAHTAAGQYVMAVSNALGIPVIAWNSDNPGVFQPTADSIILQMAPSIEHQCLAMLSLMKRYNWHVCSIVTGSVAGEVNFINTIRGLVEQDDVEYEIAAIIHIPKTTRAIIREQLQKLKVADTRVTLLYCSQKEAKTIMTVASEMGLTGKEFIWIASQGVLGDLINANTAPKEFPMGMFGIYYDYDRDRSKSSAGMKSAIKDGVRVWGQGLENLLTAQLNDSRLANISIKPNMSCDYPESMHWDSGREVYDYLRTSRVKVEDGRLLEFNEDGIVMDTVLKVFNVNPAKRWEEIGQWNKVNGLTIQDITWPGDMATPPKGRPSKYHLKVVTLSETPYVIYSDPDPKTGGCPAQAALCRIAPLNATIGIQNATANASLYQCCSGLCIDLLKGLSERIGFEYDLFQVEDKTFGGLNKDGEWNGIVRTIIDNKADMSLASLSITAERNSVIDFSVPFLETGITIIVAVRDGVISPTAFLEPYDYPSWCLILVFSVHASGAAIFIYEWLSPSGLDRGNKPIREHRFSLFRSFWLIWAMLFGAAVNTDNPRGVSGRFMANIWALFAVVFTASYTANLAAFMITKEDYDRLTGIQDWRLMNPYSHKPPFKFATVPHGSTEANLRRNYYKMYKYMQPYNRSNVEEGVRAVKEHEINAFLYDATVLEYKAGHDEGCKLRTVGNWYAMTGYGLGFPRGSKWLDIVNKHLLQLQHNGEMERLQKFWLAGACSQRQEEGESSMPLGILNFTSAFILLAGGMLLGGLLLLLEHIYFKFFRRKLRKWDRCGCCGLVSLSMGKSLTFEQSVKEAIELTRNYKCKNPVCETQVWKSKHELDLALLKIDRLQKQLLEKGMSMEPKAIEGKKSRRSAREQQTMPENRHPLPIGWKDHGKQTCYPPAPPIGWKDHVIEPNYASTHPSEFDSQMPSSSRNWFAENDQQRGNSDPTNSIGWKGSLLPLENHSSFNSPKDNAYPDVAAPSYDEATQMTFHPPNGDHIVIHDYQPSQKHDMNGGAQFHSTNPKPATAPHSNLYGAPPVHPRQSNLDENQKHPYGSPSHESSPLKQSTPERKGWKSLPSSPVKANSPASSKPLVRKSSQSGPSSALKRATSYPDTQDVKSPKHEKNRKKRNHKGNVYEEINNHSAVEIETVL